MASEAENSVWAQLWSDVRLIITCGLLNVVLFVLPKNAEGNMIAAGIMQGIAAILGKSAKGRR